MANQPASQEPGSRRFPTVATSAPAARVRSTSWLTKRNCASLLSGPHGDFRLQAVPDDEIGHGVGELFHEALMVGAVHVDALDVVTNLSGAGVHPADELGDELV